MKQKILLTILVLSSFATSAQTVLLQMDKKKENSFREERVGQNLPRFNQLFFHIGEVIPPDREGARVLFGSSMEFGFGFRRKYKVSGVYSLGWEMELNTTMYRLKEEAGKTFPDTFMNKKERFDNSGFGISFFNRINFDPQRGNHIGHYLDLSIRGQLASGQLMKKNELADGTNVQAFYTHLPYFNSAQAFVSAKLGFGHFAIYGAYRLTDLFKKNYNYSELPALTAGIELGVF